MLDLEIAERQDSESRMKHFCEWQDSGSHLEHLWLDLQRLNHNIDQNALMKKVSK